MRMEVLPAHQLREFQSPISMWRMLREVSLAVLIPSIFFVEKEVVQVGSGAVLVSPEARRAPSVRMCRVLLLARVR